MWHLAPIGEIFVQGPQSMKRPTWKLVVGILAMILGGYGVLGGAFSILTTAYYAMETEVEMVGNSSDSDSSHSEPPSHTAGGPEQNEISHKTLEQPGQPFTQSTSWVLTRGIIAFLISGAYVLAGIVLITKPFGIRFFYSALGASILWSLTQIALFSQAQMSMLMIIAPMFAPSILIDLLLGGVVYVGSRQWSVELPVSPDRVRSAETPLVRIVKVSESGRSHSHRCARGTVRVDRAFLGHGSSWRRKRLCPWMENGIRCHHVLSDCLDSRIWYLLVSEKKNFYRSSTVLGYWRFNFV